MKQVLFVADPGWLEHPTIGLEGRVTFQRSRGDRWHGATTIRAMWHGEVM